MPNLAEITLCHKIAKSPSFIHASVSLQTTNLLIKKCSLRVIWGKKDDLLHISSNHLSVICIFILVFAVMM